MKAVDALKSRVVVALLSLSLGGAGAIVAHEGLRTTAYVDPVGIVTVCAGHTKTAKLGQVKTKAECAELLRQDTKHAETAIKRLVKVKLTQRQYDALVSFVFNVGEGNFATSTLLKRINEGRCTAASQEFLRWDKAKGKRLPGLTARREYESAEFNTGCAIKVASS